MKQQAVNPISQNEFEARRNDLLKQCLPNSLCIIPAAGLVTRSNDTEYGFRQDSDFWYLTGFDEPQAWLLLSNAPQYSGYVSMIYVQPSDEIAEIWHGRRLGVDKAASVLGVQHAANIDDLDQQLVDLVDGHTNVYFAIGKDLAADQAIYDAIEACRSAPKQAKVAPQSMHDIRPIIHAMRLIKSDAELTAMQCSADVACKGHVRAMQYAYAGCNEYELEAEIKHEFAMHGAKNEAYSSIVGGGDNACILHYTENNQVIADGELVLIDAGAELFGYASDITRTFPVNGKFSQPQKELYQLVLDSQLAALDALKPGATISNAMQICVRVLVEGLVRLQILSGSVQANIENETWRAFFMHGLGHWLGLDVHDVGIYKINNEDRLLQANMVMTVEPGLYISMSADVPDIYKGIGIRIEDDIVISHSGNKVLTDKVPKTIDEIEALMRQTND